MSRPYQKPAEEHWHTDSWHPAALIHAIEQAASEGGLPEKEVPACFTSFPDGK